MNAATVNVSIDDSAELHEFDGPQSGPSHIATVSLDVRLGLTDDLDIASRVPQTARIAVHQPYDYDTDGPKTQHLNIPFDLLRPLAALLANAAAAGESLTVHPNEVDGITYAGAYGD